MIGLSEQNFLNDIFVGLPGVTNLLSHTACDFDIYTVVSNYFYQILVNDQKKQLVIWFHLIAHQVELFAMYTFVQTWRSTPVDNNLVVNVT